MNGCGVLLSDGGLGCNARVFGKRKHLKEGAVKNEEVFLDQGVSCLDIDVYGNAQVGADAVIGVERNTVSVPCQEQKQVKQQFVVREGVEKAILQEAMFNKGEGASNGSDPLWGKDVFFNHGRLLFDPRLMARCGEGYRVLFCKILVSNWN